MKEGTAEDHSRSEARYCRHASSLRRMTISNANVLLQQAAICFCAIKAAKAATVGDQCE